MTNLISKSIKSMSEKNKRTVQRSLTAKLMVLFFVGFLVGSIFTNSIFLSEEEAIELDIVYSSEKASWMTVAYGNFLEFWEENHPNEKIKLQIHPYGSSDSMIAILNREIFPTIWSPASSIWLPFLNAKWRTYTGGEQEIVNISEAVRIIYSPVVIATWEEFNETHNIQGFSDIHRLSVDPDVEMRMAHTDPRLSNSGFMSVIMALKAATGKSSKDFKMEDLTNETNQKWLKEFESSAVLYGKSTGFLSRYMRNEGPNGLNIAFLYENLIRDISGASESGKIIAIYPEEGTLYSDHPFSILNGDWITPDQRRVAEEFLNFLNRPETVISAMESGFRPINRSISLDPEVFNYEENGIAYDINVPELSVPEDGNVLLRIPDLWLLSKAS